MEFILHSWLVMVNNKKNSWNFFVSLWLTKIGYGVLLPFLLFGSHFQET